MENQWKTSIDYLSDEAEFLFSKEVGDLTCIVGRLYFQGAAKDASEAVVKRLEELDQELMNQVNSVGIQLFSPGGTLPRVLNDVLGSYRDSQVAPSYKTLLESKMFRSKVRAFAATLLEANTGAIDDLRFGRGWGRYNWDDVIHIFAKGNKEDAISLLGPWAENGDREAIYSLSVLLRCSTKRTNAGTKALEVLKSMAETGDSLALSCIRDILSEEKSAYKV